MSSLLRPLVVFICALSMSACSNPFSASDELEEAREKWEDQGIDSYRITVRESCFCPIELGGPFVVTVVRGQVASVVYTGEGTDVVPVARIPLTVDMLFDTVEQAERDAAEVRVEYDPTYGFPATIFVDRIQNAVDDEVYYEARDFQAIR